MRQLLKWCQQALPKSVDRALRRLSRLMNGEVAVVSQAEVVVIERKVIPFEKVGVSEFVQESYKWPVSIIKSKLGRDGEFVDRGFSISMVNGAIVAGDGRAFDSHHRLVRESLATHDYQAINPGKWAHHVSREIEGLALALNWWSGNTNLYHWLRDVFARAFTLTAFQGERITIIAPDQPRPFQQHGLNALLRDFPECRVTNVPFGQKVRVERLIQPCVNPYVRGNGFLRIEVANFIRDTYLRNLLPTDRTPITYISRQSVASRRLLDEAEVLERVSREFPLKVLAIEQLPFPDQLKLMASTDVLAGIYGAGLVHLLFTSRGGLVEIHNGDSRETHFSTLSVGCEAPYRVVQGGLADQKQDFRLGSRGIDALLAAFASLLST